MSDLKHAQERIEMVRQLQRKVCLENQPRQEMRDQLQLAKAEINTALSDMDLENDLKGGETNA